ncbi:MAG TPA: helix-turn-helix domain-containing protein [Micromonosporaceae bacterium]|nr:helix-turn-helix domain-containing protein [Micromonosporaceae bacterium]
MTGAPWQAVAALVDPVRRRLYEYVRRQDHPVTREEAADAHSISPNLTAFHLDKLVEAQLLTARYEAPSDQPRGRGRTPKVYEPAAEGIDLSIPQRRYELIGEILADTVAGSPDDTRCAAERHAFERGREYARQWRQLSGHAGAPEPLVEALADLGFEPRQDPAEGEVRLGNCPFHVLAERQRDLVCGLNHAFVSGLLDGLGVRDVAAHLRPPPSGCCVVLRRPD